MQCSGFSRCGELLDCCGPELLVQQVRALRSKPRQGEHGSDAGGTSMRQLIQHRQVLAVGDDGDRVSQVLADAGRSSSFSPVVSMSVTLRGRSPISRGALR